MTMSLENRLDAFRATIPPQIDLEDVKEKLKAITIETPSWGYGAMGTRFYTLHKPGAPRTVYEKLQDAAQVHQYTGVAGAVAVHIPWDKVDDYGQLRAHANSVGVEIGSVNANL